MREKSAGEIKKKEQNLLLPILNRTLELGYKCKALK